MTVPTLICFPHAGGSAAAFAPLRTKLAGIFDLHAHELPGRGSRLRESLHTERRVLVTQLALELAPQLTTNAYALLGHSLGAIVAFELAHTLQAQLGRAPKALFVAAASAPTTRRSQFLPRPLTDDELKEELRRRGGTPPEVLEHAELLELVLPVVRADFQLCNGACPIDRGQLDCPIHVFGGTRDDIGAHELEAWGLETNAAFSLTWIDGDHFFVQRRAAEIAAEIAARLGPARLGSRTHRDSAPQADG